MPVPGHIPHLMHTLTSQTLHTGLTSDLPCVTGLLVEPGYCYRTCSALLFQVLWDCFHSDDSSCACLVPASLPSPSPCCYLTHLSSVRHPATLAQFSACQNEPFLCFEKVILEDQPALQSSFAIQTSLPFDPTKQTPQARQTSVLL